MEIRAGTSGYSYAEWKGSFYPEKIKPADMLAYYAERLPAVEINNTFYRMPRREVVAGWASQVPASFRFAIKASQRITHRKRLKDVEEEIDHLLGQLEPLGPRLGLLLLQLPPNLKKDLGRLERFLEHLNGRARVAFEFRSATWQSEDVVACLRAHGAAYVASETEDAPAALHETAPFGYLRLRRSDYTTHDLSAWAERLRPLAWEEAYVFFKHEDAGAGPTLAAEFFALFAQETYALTSQRRAASVRPSAASDRRAEREAG